MSYPANSDAPAQDQLRAFVERILRMKEEAKAIKDDIREIYAEAKGNGFDKTVLGQIVSYVEKRGQDNAKLLEREALFQLYLEAFDGVGTINAIAHTHENSAASIPPEVAADQGGEDVAAEPDVLPAPEISGSMQLRPAPPFRPYCLHADDLSKCAGQGRKHCFACEKVNADSQGFAA